MYSWWNRGVHNEAAGRSGGILAERGPTRTRQVHVEVIGGAYARSPSSSRSHPIPEGPPRLPSEIVSEILLLAARTCSQDVNHTSRNRVQGVLRLACVNRAAHRDIHAYILLPDLRLHGIKQVVSFARTLDRNAVNMQRLAARIVRLTIYRSDSSRITARGSLYDDIEDLARFERAVHTSLRTILSYCTNLRYLSLDMTARVLDLRWSESMSMKRVMNVCSSLKELVTMLSLYGGDMNERLWDPSYGSAGVSTSRWASLTHLQLHGPRFRMTAMTALALCSLPNLTHLCLIMPWILQGIPESVSPEQLTRNSRQIERAVDMTGRETVLQLLYSGLGHSLRHLVLVCHDADGYVGSLTKLGPMFRALHWWEEGTYSERRTSSSPTTLTLAAARFQSNSTQTPDAFHPSMLSRWMYILAQSEQHWELVDGMRGETDEGVMTMTVDSWKAPTAYEPEQRNGGATLPSPTATVNGAVNSDLNGGIDDLD